MSTSGSGFRGGRVRYGGTCSSCFVEEAVKCN